MKATKPALLLLIFMIGRSVSEEQGTYTTKYDNVDIDEVLGSERLLTGYVNCLLDRGPCTPDGKELKRNLPDAIDNDCSKCTAKQREGADRVMDYIIDHRPDDWAKLEEKNGSIIKVLSTEPFYSNCMGFGKYNSDGTYKEQYLARKKAAAALATGTTPDSENATETPEKEEEEE